MENILNIYKILSLSTNKIRESGSMQVKSRDDRILYFEIDSFEKITLIH